MACFVCYHLADECCFLVHQSFALVCQCYFRGNLADRSVCMPCIVAASPCEAYGLRGVCCCRGSYTRSGTRIGVYRLNYVADRVI